MTLCNDQLAKNNAEKALLLDHIDVLQQQLYHKNKPPRPSYAITEARHLTSEEYKETARRKELHEKVWKPLMKELKEKVKALKKTEKDAEKEKEDKEKREQREKK